MADEFIGFQGTVNEVQWASLMAGIGQKYTLITGDPVRSSGRTVHVDPRSQIGCGVLFKHDAVKSLAISAPTAGQWHLLVARRNWAGKSVSYVLIPGNVTSDVEQADPPTALPAARNKSVGIVDDEPIAWVHARASSTSLKIWQMSIKRDGRAPGKWALFNAAELGLTRAFSEADALEYVFNNGVWRPEFASLLISPGPGWARNASYINTISRHGDFVVCNFVFNNASSGSPTNLFTIPSDLLPPFGGSISEAFATGLVSSNSGNYRGQLGVRSTGVAYVSYPTGAASGPISGSGTWSLR